MRLSQASFGEIGGVKANAQGNYESGLRFPGADYFALLADAGLDVLYVITGNRTPIKGEGLSMEEMQIIASYRTLPEADQAVALRTITALAELVARQPQRP